jgi:hypothetical protein
MTLTKEQADVLFHILNNMHTSTTNAAMERALECDGINSTQFLRIHRDLIRSLSNFEAIEG